jgi:hypothetical protein
MDRENPSQAGGETRNDKADASTTASLAILKARHWLNDEKNNKSVSCRLGWVCHDVPIPAFSYFSGRDATAMNGMRARASSDWHQFSSFG